MHEGQRYYSFFVLTVKTFFKIRNINEPIMKPLKDAPDPFFD